MTQSLTEYRQLERRLWMARWRNEGQESEEEDAILDAMENTWWRLTPDERELLNREGPTCWPMEPSFTPPYMADALDPSMPTVWEYEGFHSPEDAISLGDAA